MADRAFLEQFRLTPEGRALLGVIKYAEGTSKYKNPYGTLFGGGQVTDLSRHPDRVIRTPGFQRGSSAAGAYQFLTPTWQQQAQKLGLKSFGPLEQDIAALDLARNRLGDLGGLSYLKQKGLTREALAALAPEWASMPTMANVSYYGQPVKNAAELQKMYQQYSAGAPAQQAIQAPPSVSRANTRPAPAPVAPQASAPTAIQKPGPDYFQNLMRGVQGLFGTTGGRRSSAADEYFDAALEYDAAGDSDTALALYTKAFESDQPVSNGNATALQTFASMIPELISEYVTAPAPTMNQAAIQQTQSQPAATQPAMTTAAANRALAAGRVVDPSKDVFPSTGAHLDVRVMKDGNYINPETARSILKNLYVGGKPLYTQQDQYRTAAYPITSGFGPRTAPVAGASTYHRGIDIGVGAGTPLEWRGGGTFKPERGYGVIETTDPQGRPYTVKLLHTTSS